MFILKFRKQFPANLIAHTDLLNIFSRIIKRAELEVEYSAGFNPHPLINFSAPLPLGTLSECEYAFINSKENEEDFIKRFNENSVKGLTALAATAVEKDPNIYFNIEMLEFFVQINIKKNDAEKLFEYITKAKNENNLFIKYELKEKKYNKNVSDSLKEIEIEKNDLINNDKTCDNDKTCFRFVVSCGEDNLRIDRLILSCATSLGIDYEINYIKKTKAFFKKDFCLHNFN